MFIAELIVLVIQEIAHVNLVIVVVITTVLVTSFVPHKLKITDVLVKGSAHLIQQLVVVASRIKI